MKKKAFNLLFIIILSFSCLSIVNAKFSNDTHVDVSLAISSDNGSRSFASQGTMGFDDLTCVDINTKKETPVNYGSPVEIAKGVFINNLGGGQGYKVTTANQKDKSLTVKCGYGSAPYYYTSEGVAGAGTLNLTLNFTKTEIKEFEYEISLNVLTNLERRVTGNQTPFSFLEKGDYIFESCKVESGPITCSQASSGATIYVDESAAQNLKDNETAEAVVKYVSKTDNNDTYIIKVHVKLNNTALVIADFGGQTCNNWDAGWKAVTADEGSQKYKEMPNLKTKKEYRMNGNPIPVPKCNDFKIGGITYEFKGWYIHDRTNNGNITVQSDVCSNYKLYNGTVDYSTLKKEVLQYNRFIYTCYAPKENVIVSLDNYLTEIDGSEYKKVNGDAFDLQYYKEPDASDNKAALPSVKYYKMVDGKKKEDKSKKFIAWYNVDDLERKTPYKAGDKVPAGKYYLETQLNTYTGQVVSVNKEMIIGATENLKLTQVKTMSGCSSADNAKVSATFNSDTKSCTVSANELTGNGNIVVTVMGVDDKGEDISVKVKITVKNNQGTDEGTILNSYTGDVYTVTGFLTNSAETEKKCTNYTIQPTIADRDHGLVRIIEHLSFRRSDVSYKDSNGENIDSKVYRVRINDNVYRGSATCDGETINIAAVCIDPSRDEPSPGGSNYILDHQTSGDVDNSYLDKLTIVIYNKPEYRNAINNVAKNRIGNEDKQYIAAATFAYRLLAIKVGEGANDDSSSMSDYYYAYKSLVEGINKKWGKTIDDWKKNSKKLADGDITSNYVLDVFCTGANSCEQPEPSILIKALKLIKEAVNKDTDKKKLTVSAYVASEKTNILDNNGKYEKIIEGKYTDIPTDTATISEHFLSVRPSCESCDTYIKLGALSVKFEIGRDLNHLVGFDETMNVLTAKYKDFNQYKDSDYKNKHLYNEDGTMVFRYTITGDLNAITSIAHSPSGAGVGTGTGGAGGAGAVEDLRSKAKEFTISTSMGLDDEDYVLNTGQANADNSANFQRMEIFHEIDGHGEVPGRDTPIGGGDNGYIGSGSGGPGNKKGWNGAFDIHAKPSVRVVYNPGRERHLIISYNTREVGSFLPACDFNDAKYNYKTCTSATNCNGFDPFIFVGAGCCNTILDESHYVYKTYCTNKCVQSSYSPICKNDESKPDDETVNKEHLLLREAYRGDQVDYTCIYDPSNVAKTWEKKDSVGNNYAHSALKFENNPTCAISCKEDWDFMVPSLSNHIGANAVVAGQYFVMGRDTIQTTGTRTCITTRINIKGWSDQVESESSQLVYKFSQTLLADMIGELLSTTANVSNFAFENDGPYYYCNDTYAVEYQCRTNYNVCHRYSEDGIHCEYGFEWPETTSAYYPEGQCPAGYSPVASSKRYNREKCREGGTPYDPGHSCKNTTAAKGPNIGFNWYTWNGAVNTKSDNYQFEDHDIPPNFFPGSNYAEDGHAECKENTDEGIRPDNYLEKRGGYVTEKATAEITAKADGIVPDAGANWQVHAGNISGLLRSMRQCQYWSLNIRNNNKIKEDPNSNIKIQTEFNPDITYSYAEPGFMEQLAGHNTLQRKDKEYKFSYAYYADGMDPKKYEGTLATTGSAEEAIYIVTNDDTEQTDALIKGTGLDHNSGKNLFTYQPFASCSKGGGGSAVVGGNKAGEGGGVITWGGGAGCGTGLSEYINNAYYIKRQATIKSEYDSDEFRWYIDNQNSFRTLGLNKNDAISRSHSPNKDPNKWSPYGVAAGSKNLVFPISETTPRNIYQYAFTYRNVGNYNDNSNINLGRIMGTNKSVIGNNNRVCFYEVIEGVCYCCGDILETELVGTTSSTTTYDILNKKKSTGLTNSSGNDLTCSGNDCNDYLSSYIMSSPITKSDIDDHRGEGQYNVSVNSVSLNSVTKDAGRPMGANWSKGQHYLLEGYVYATDKGALLLENIEEKGENIYDASANGNNANYPEYSYTLSPKALSEIRNISETSGYQEKSNSMEVFGYTKLYSDNTKSWNPINDEDPGIAHFASKFLSDTVSSYVTQDYKDVVLSRLTKNNNPICYVYGYDGKTGFKFGPNGNVFRGNGEHVSKATDCRWIDFVGLVQKAKDYTKSNAGKLDNNKNYYRLSFK